jgi:regulator of cell morphogenesis and NO signaling
MTTTAVATAAGIAPTTRVADVAREHPSTVRVFQRHGVDFCCGGKRSLAEACAKHHLDLDVLVSDLEAAVDGSAGAGFGPPATASLADLAKYIVGRYHVSLRAELPRLGAMVDKVDRVHGEHAPEIPPLAAAFRELVAEITDHLVQEEELAFPLIARLEAGDRPRDLVAPLSVLEDQHAAVGALLARLRATSHDYTPPEWACNTFRGLYHGLAELERELQEHIHLENNVLFPRALAIVSGGTT